MTTTRIDKRTRAEQFRERLRQAIATAGQTQSGLARDIGADRSTLSALLTDQGARLPNAQLVAECAAALGISADWLLGLTDRPEQAEDLVASAMTMAQAPRALVDETIFAWHREAAGYKIRHVPAGLPDMLKTRDVLRWEYEPSLGRTTEQAIGASEDRLGWMRGSRSDYEIALPLHELDGFAAGTGYYAGLPARVRAEQLARLRALHDQLYPRLRLFLFDARRIYSAPVTVFGPLLAVIYLGQNYLAFRDAARVATLSAHFDHLVREAEVGERGIGDHLARLADSVAG